MKRLSADDTWGATPWENRPSPGCFAVCDGLRQDGALSYLLLDHLGSTTTVLADQNSDWDAGRLYYAYGRLRYDQGLTHALAHEGRAV